MNGKTRHFFEFDAFRVEVEERRLWRDGELVTLSPRAFDILAALVQNSGQTIDKNALMKAVWTDAFVEEGNLNHHISSLRKVLGDDPREQRLIKTIPKRGYRFTSQVRESVDSHETLAIENVSTRRLVIREETTEGFWTTPRTAIAAVVLIAAGFLGAWALSGSGKSEARERSSVNREAREAFTQGRALWQDRTAGSLHEATLLLEKAIELDPDFALAHAALADAYAFDYGNWGKAKSQARRAIELDPKLGEPHASIGFVRLFWEWDLEGAEQELKQAVNLSPEYATGHQWFALALAANHTQRDAALVEIRKAMALEPNSLAINTDYCQLLYHAEKFDEAGVQCRKVLDMNPDSPAAAEWLYQISMSSGDLDAAVERFTVNISKARSDKFHHYADDLRTAYLTGGIDGFRKVQIALFREERSFYKAARVFAESGQAGAAIDSLKLAEHNRELDYVFIASDPAFGDLRGTDRWLELSYPPPPSGR
jgi:DNA-binding winged helix-turn-helix (wHTH) protein/Tfp pilus assembly protein PilF